jgi:hypothetical protein
MLKNKIEKKNQLQKRQKENSLSQHRLTRHTTNLDHKTSITL